MLGLLPQELPEEKESPVTSKPTCGLWHAGYADPMIARNDIAAREI
jgi:hypothetical protein